MKYYVNLLCSVKAKDYEEARGIFLQSMKHLKNFGVDTQPFDLIDDQEGVEYHEDNR